MRLTLRTVNDELVKRGIRAVLGKGEGEYFYFSGGETREWWDRTVQVAKISDLTLEQWIEAYRDLKRRNAQIMALGAARTPKAGRAKRRAG